MGKVNSYRKFALLLTFLFPIILCFSFYFFVIREPLTSGNPKVFIKLPYFGPYKGVTINSDTIHYTLPGLNLRNQNNDIVDSTTLSDKIYLLAMVDFSSPEADQLGAQMFTVQRKLDYLRKQFHVVAILKNTGNDTLAALKQYADKVHAHLPLWNVTAGPAQKAFEVFENHDLLSRHTQQFNGSLYMLLIDRKNNIRGIYRSNTLTETSRLINEAAVLASEYGRIKKTH